METKITEYSKFMMYYGCRCSPGYKGLAQHQRRRKYTAQQIKKGLTKNHPAVLEYFKVNAKDRVYQFWERNALSIELRTDKVFEQKLNYLHYNPVRAGLCNLPEEYAYSTAKWYETNINNWEFITQYG